MVAGSQSGRRHGPDAPLPLPRFGIVRWGGNALRQRLTPQLPGKPARLTRQALPGANRDDLSGWGAEDVEFFVVARQRRQELEVRHAGWLRHCAGGRPDPDQPSRHG